MYEATGHQLDLHGLKRRILNNIAGPLVMDREPLLRIGIWFFPIPGADRICTTSSTRLGYSSADIHDIES